MVGTYLTLSDVEKRIHKQFTSTTIPTASQMEDYITWSEADFDAEFGEHSESTTIDEVLDAYSFGLITKRKPIKEIIQIFETIGSKYDLNWSDTPLPTRKYRIKNANIGYIEMASPLMGESTYKIDYTSGYSYSEMPHIIKEIVLLMALRYAFEEVLFKEGNIDASEKVVDVDVYREITRGGSPFRTFSELDSVLNRKKELFKNRLKTFFK